MRNRIITGLATTAGFSMLFVFGATSEASAAAIAPSSSQNGVVTPQSPMLPRCGPSNDGQVIFYNGGYLKCHYKDGFWMWSGVSGGGGGGGGGSW